MRSSPSLYRLNYKAQKRPSLTVFFKSGICPYAKNFLQTGSEIVLSWHVSSNTQNAPGAFSHKGFVFCALPHQRTARIPRAPKARANKNWRFCGKYCPQIYPEMLFSEVFPCYAIISPLYRLNYKAQKRPPVTVFFK